MVYRLILGVLTKKGDGLGIWHTSFSENLVYRSHCSAVVNFNKYSEIAACCSIGSQISKFRNWVVAPVVAVWQLRWPSNRCCCAFFIASDSASTMPLSL